VDSITKASHHVGVSFDLKKDEHRKGTRKKAEGRIKK